MKLIDNWEFGVLGIYNYREPGKLDNYFKNIYEVDKHLEGDICEVGVYKGSSLLATSLFLKEIGSEKLVYGFDSFSGFPEYHPNDNLSMFKRLYDLGAIDEDHFESTKLNQEHRSLFIENISVENISTSGDFSNCQYSILKKKIDYLKLDNIRLIEGNFNGTMNESSLKEVKFSSCLIDCDLYEGYKIALPFVWKRMVNNGYIFLDEYYSLKFPGARIATDEFFSNRNTAPAMHQRIKGDFERWYVRKMI